MSSQIEHIGQVMSVDGDMAHVRIMQASACGSCAANGRCMAAEAKEKFIDCQISEPLSVGDEVLVLVEQRLGWLAICLAFVLPFFLLVGLVALLGQFMSEGIAGTIALLSLLVYAGVLALFKGKLKRTFSFRAVKKK